MGETLPPEQSETDPGLSVEHTNSPENAVIGNAEIAIEEQNTKIASSSTGRNNLKNKLAIAGVTVLVAAAAIYGISRINTNAEGETPTKTPVKTEIVEVSPSLYGLADITTLPEKYNAQNIERGMQDNTYDVYIINGLGTRTPTMYSLEYKDGMYTLTQLGPRSKIPNAPNIEGYAQAKTGASSSPASVLIVRDNEKSDASGNDQGALLFRSGFTSMGGLNTGPTNDQKGVKKQIEGEIDKFVGGGTGDFTYRVWSDWSTTGAGLK